MGRGVVSSYRGSGHGLRYIDALWAPKNTPSRRGGSSASASISDDARKAASVHDGVSFCRAISAESDPARRKHGEIRMAQVLRTGFGAGNIRPDFPELGYS